MTWQDDLTNVGLRQSVIRKLHDTFDYGNEFTFKSIVKSLENRGVKHLKSKNLRKYLDNADWIRKKESSIKDASVIYMKRM
jgi:hypothetical protein